MRLAPPPLCAYNRLELSRPTRVQLREQGSRRRGMVTVQRRYLSGLRTGARQADSPVIETPPPPRPVPQIH